MRGFFSDWKNNNMNINNQEKEKNNKEIKKEEVKYHKKRNKKYNNNIINNSNTISNQNDIYYNNNQNNQNISNYNEAINVNYNNFNHSFSQQFPNFINQAKIQSEKEEEEEEEDEIEEKEVKEKEDKKKCSLNEHNEIDAVIYCQECKVYMCKKCENVHSGLLKNHHFYSLDKNINEIFTGLCTKPNHSMSLEYFCKTHNQLCCAACISKIRNKGNGGHKNCKVYDISKIKNKKKNILEKNITNLEELSNKLEPSINELKTIFEKINEAKENLKAKVQKIFTKIRNEINDREDKLFLEIDKKFQELFFNEEFVKESEKLPNLVKNSLEKGKIKESNWKNKSLLNKIINDCINIENTVKNINEVYDKINNYNSNKELEIKFIPKDEEIEQRLDIIREFGGLEVKDNNQITLPEIVEANIQPNILIESECGQNLNELEVEH